MDILHKCLKEAKDITGRHSETKKVNILVENLSPTVLCALKLIQSVWLSQVLNTLELDISNVQSRTCHALEDTRQSGFPLGVHKSDKLSNRCKEIPKKMPHD